MYRILNAWIPQKNTHAQFFIHVHVLLILGYN